MRHAASAVVVIGSSGEARYRLGRTDLHFGDPETGPSSVTGATFNLIRPACGA